MDFFVSKAGKDSNPGTLEQPFETIARGVAELGPGDVLNLRHGVYVEHVEIVAKHGTPDAPIVIRSYQGQAYIDGTLAEFRRPDNNDWVLAKTVDAEARDDEYVSARTFTEEAVNRGAFLDRNPYTRLVSYSNINDLRAENETFDKIVDENDPRPGPDAVHEKKGTPLGFRRPWVYMGPGIHFNRGTGRIHIRLAHTHNNVPGLIDYAGETDPRQVALAITPKAMMAVQIRGSSYLRLEQLTIRFGGDQTIRIEQVKNLTLDHVRIRAATMGIRMSGRPENLTKDVVFAHCEFRGGVPSWYFRTDRKSVYHFIDGGKIVNNDLGENTSDRFLLGNPFNASLEIHHCEFLNGHDVFLEGQGVDFHHNWINGLQDDGLAIGFDGGSDGPITVTKIHENVITKTLSCFSIASKNQTTQWYIYRNLIDQRGRIAGIRPRHVGDTNVWRFGQLHKSTGGALGPHDLFHNTVLTYDQREQASFLHYKDTTVPHRRRSFNNVFIAVNPGTEADDAITFVPSPGFPGPTDGNLYHRMGS